MDSEPPKPKKVMPAHMVTFSSVPGLYLHYNFITQNEENALIRTCNTFDLVETPTNRFIRFHKELPEWAEVIINRLIEWNIVKEKPDDIIIHDCMPGQGIHTILEDEDKFGDIIVIISLGCTVQMEFRNCENKNLRYEFMVNKRSALVISGDARYKWRHGVRPRTQDKRIRRERRLSITLKKDIS